MLVYLYECPVCEKLEWGIWNESGVEIKYRNRLRVEYRKVKDKALLILKIFKRISKINL